MASYQRLVLWMVGHTCAGMSIREDEFDIIDVMRISEAHYFVE